MKRPSIQSGWTYGISSKDDGLLERIDIWVAFKDRRQSSVVADWYYDTTLEFRQRSELARQIFLYGSFEPNEFVALETVLQDGGVFVDVGANEGAYSIAMARRVGAAGRVISFEPSDRERESLNENISRNRLSNVTVCDCAVADVSGSAELYLMPEEFAGLNSMRAVNIIDYSTLPSLRCESSASAPAWLGIAGPVTRLDFKPRNDATVALYSERRFVFTLRRLGVDLSPRDRLTCTARWLRWLMSQRWRDVATWELAWRVRPFVFSTIGEVGSRRGTAGGVTLTGAESAEWRFSLRTPQSAPRRIFIRGEGGKIASEQKVVVHTKCLDDYFGQHPVSRLDAIKIDVEGAELGVLRGATQMIERYNPMIVVELCASHLSKFGSSVADVVDYFRQRGYEMVDLSAGSFNLVVGLPSKDGNYVGVSRSKLDEFRRAMLNS